MCTGSALLLKIIYPPRMGAIIGWELTLGLGAVGGAVVWIARRKRVAQEIAQPLLEPGSWSVPAIPAPSNQAPAGDGQGALTPG